MATAPSSPDIQVGACVYILHGLLQRLEARDPGLVVEMLSGLRADYAAASTHVGLPELNRQVYEEAIRMIELVHHHNQMAGISPKSSP